MGFQGRPGPHGPPGVGEPGLPVSSEASQSVLQFYSCEVSVGVSGRSAL